MNDDRFIDFRDKFSGLSLSDDVNLPLPGKLPCYPAKSAGRSAAMRRKALGDKEGRQKILFEENCSRDYSSVRY